MVVRQIWNSRAAVVMTLSGVHVNKVRRDDFVNWSHFLNELIVLVER